MNWKWKARLQRTCARLPFGEESAYYLLQSAFGRLRARPDPFPMLEACAELVAHIENAGKRVSGSRVMEVGTGRGIDMPLGFYLCGAESVVTFDLHRYLKPHIVLSGVRTICEQEKRTLKILEGVADAKLVARRLKSLRSARNGAEVLGRAKVEYRAPADAARTGLPDRSIDIHLSYTVFEHIPRRALKSILLEANRIVRPGGVTLHHIDPSDHFSHVDSSILPINFLQYSDQEWERLAGNQFAYHNRMRANEFAELYSECAHEVLFWKPHIDAASHRALTNGFPVHPRFRRYTPDVLSTVVLQVLSRPLAASCAQSRTSQASFAQTK